MSGGNLFAHRQKGATHDELRGMAALMRGFHYRHAESWALLARLLATDPLKWPQGLDGIVIEHLDGGWWSFAWNGTDAEIEVPSNAPWNGPPVKLWPRHCRTDVKGMPQGLWSDSAGWQDHEARWLRALEAHVVRRELQQQTKETQS